jgi:hypothetical protein
MALIERLSTMGEKHLSDELIAIAYNIEQAFIQVGAEPVNDYTYKDLFQLAQPFVLDMFRNVKGFEYSYQSDSVGQETLKMIR